MRAKYGSNYKGLEWSAAQGYDAFMLLANAMRLAKIDPSDLLKARAQVRDALEQTKGYIGPFGMYTITPQDQRPVPPRRGAVAPSEDPLKVVLPAT